MKNGMSMVRARARAVRPRVKARHATAHRPAIRLMETSSSPPARGTHGWRGRVATVHERAVRLEPGRDAGVRAQGDDFSRIVTISDGMTTGKAQGRFVRFTNLLAGPKTDRIPDAARPWGPAWSGRRGRQRPVP